MPNSEEDVLEPDIMEMLDHLDQEGQLVAQPLLPSQQTLSTEDQRTRSSMVNSFGMVS